MRANFVSFRTHTVIVRKNPAIFKTHPVEFRTNPLIAISIQFMFGISAMLVKSNDT